MPSSSTHPPDSPLDSPTSSRNGRSDAAAGDRPAVEVRGLRKTFGDNVALHDLSFTVPRGTVVGLLGPNGAGKTTAINCVTTLLAPDAGTAEVCGHDIHDDPDGVRSSLAVTGQFAAVDEGLTGVENLVFFSRLLGLDRTRAAARADELLGRFELASAGDQPVGEYSGGMRRKLDLAASLVVPRPVLILDEPTTGLDPGSRETLWNIVRELAADGMAILLTTQYLEEADELADWIVVIDEGTVIAEGGPGELKQRVGTSVCEVGIADAAERHRAGEVLATVADVGHRGDSLIVSIGDTGDLASIVRLLDSDGIAADNIEVHRPTLNDVFFALTSQGTSR